VHPDEKATTLDRIREIFLNRDNIVISTHMDADADGLGTEIALSRYLAGKGKNVLILNSDPTPPSLQFLDEEGSIKHLGENGWEEPLGNAELFIGVDLTDFRRLGPLFEFIQTGEFETVTLDHHPFAGNSGSVFADYRVIRPDACATGEIIYDLVQLDTDVIPTRIALPLYVSIVADTGSFRFSNSTARSHVIAADLISTGIEPRKVYKKLFEAYTLNRMKLLGRALSELKVSGCGSIAWLTVSKRMMEEAGCFNGETDGFADIPRTLADVKLSILFRENLDGTVKLSFRSEDPVNVYRLARNFGGGGHGAAAGALVEGRLEDVEREVLAAVEKYIVNREWEGRPHG